jgi:hypothetical protein
MRLLITAKAQAVLSRDAIAQSASEMVRFHGVLNLLDLSVVLSMLIIIFPQEKGETDAYTQLSGILSTWEATQAELSEGEMDFKVVQQLANKKHVYTGVVGW